jgi:hypothetical protein
MSCRAGPGGIAHDFNNLLTAILGNTDLLIASPTETSALMQVVSVRHAVERGAI